MKLTLSALTESTNTDNLINGIPYCNKNDIKKMEVVSKYTIKSLYQDKNSEKSQLGNNVQLYTLTWDKRIYSKRKNLQLYASIKILI